MGTDVRDIHAQKDRWLAENPSIKIIEDGDIKREPQEPADAFWRKACRAFPALALSGRGEWARCIRDFDLGGGARQRQDRPLGLRKPAPPLKFLYG